MKYNFKGVVCKQAESKIIIQPDFTRHIVGLIVVPLGFLFYLPSITFSHNVIILILKWAGVIIMLLGIVALVMGILLRPLQRFIFDNKERVLIFRREKIPYQQISGFQLVESTISTFDLYTLKITFNGKTFTLVPQQFSAFKEPMNDLVKELNSKIQFGPTKPLKEVTEKVSAKNFVVILLITLGVLWSGVGYFALPDVIITHRNIHSGPLFWPLGIWIAVLGLLKLAGVPFDKWLREGPQLYRWLFIILWLGSYLILSLRPGLF